jgi:hypothetical protein
MQLAMERCIVGDHRRHATTTSHPKLQFLYQWADKGFDFVLGLSHGLLSMDSRNVGDMYTESHSSARASKLQLWIVLLTC